MQIILLSGHRKSGTSLLQKLFDSHPDVITYPVDATLLYDYLPYFSKLNSSSRKERIIQCLKKAFSGIEGLTLYKQKPSRPFNINGFIDIFLKCDNILETNHRFDLLVSLGEAWNQYADGDLSLKKLIIKETSQSIYAHEYINKSAKFKLVQLIRDPRDNFAAIKAGVKSYYSLMGETNKKSLASFINRARIDLLTGSSLNQEKDSNWYYPIKFEDLTSNPKNIMNNLALFCEVEYVESNLLSPTILGNNYHGNSHDNIRHIGISSRNTLRWHERLNPTEINIIEYFMKDVMKSWGYLSKDFDLEKEHIIAASEFYTWYNNEYFYSDTYA